MQVKHFSSSTAFTNEQWESFEPLASKASQQVHILELPQVNHYIHHITPAYLSYYQA